MKTHYPDIALHVPSLLLPAANVPLETWAVIACDQHTSEPEYWAETRGLIGDAPSTLDLVLPEALLTQGDREAAIAEIHRNMERYVESGVLVQQPPGFMLVERDAGGEHSRRGLVVALDLERFDHREGAQELIRSTEGTDPRRLPARTAVRRDAALETPHILVLLDDPKRTVIEPLFQDAGQLAYDFPLMQGGGRVRGWPIQDEARIEATAARIAALQQGDPPLIYAMGDGNHSFAAARTLWEELRDAGAPPDHPARFALVELVNIHDQALEFEAIHRLVAEVEPSALLTAMSDHFDGAGFTLERHESPTDWHAARQRASSEPGHTIPFIQGSAAGVSYGLARIASPNAQLAATTLQRFLDDHLPGLKGTPDLDFIHGEDTLLGLVQDHPNRIGFLLPALNKHELFASVVRDGATPRKTFSLGEAHQKRYYIECRRILPD